MEKRSAPFYATLALLLLLNIGIWLLKDAPSRGPSLPLVIPYSIGEWLGTDVELSHNEEAVLAPAKITSRAYTTRADQPVIWLNVIQSNSIGKLHNFMDSLEASGSKPKRLKTLVIPTAKGPLRTSLIRYFNAEGQPYYLLLWYQWEGGNAEERWRWYQEVLKLRFQRKYPVWHLVEAATPVSSPEKDSISGHDLERLQRFAQQFYEAANFRNLGLDAVPASKKMLDTELRTPRSSREHPGDIQMKQFQKYLPRRQYTP